MLFHRSAFALGSLLCILVAAAAQAQVQYHAHLLIEWNGATPKFDIDSIMYAVVSAQIEAQMSTVYENDFPAQFDSLETTGSESLPSGDIRSRFILHFLDDPALPTRDQLQESFDDVLSSATLAIIMSLINPNPDISLIVCEENCRDCQDEDTCVECVHGYMMVDGECVTSENPGTTPPPCGSGPAVVVQDYGNRERDCWLFPVEMEHRGRLTCTSFCTEAGYDYLTVYSRPSGDGEDADVFLNAFSDCYRREDEATDEAVVEVVGRAGEAMYVVWTSDIFTTDEGFRCYFQQEPAPAPCSTDINVTSTDYGENEDMCWSFTADDGMNNRLWCETFCSEQGYDYLTIYDGADTTAPVLASYSGCNIDVDVTGSSPHMYVTWSSDSEYNYDGFTCHWEQVWNCDHVANCAVCSNAETCDECEYRYNLENQGTVCTADCSYIGSCVECSDPYTCTACEEDTFYILVNNECLPECPVMFNSCIECDYEDYQCVECQQGYMVSDRYCEADCSLVENCAECSEPGRCDQCQQGYTLNYDYTECNIEVDCSVWDHCLECTADDGCTQCEAGIDLVDGECHEEVTCSDEQEIIVENYENNESRCWTYTAPAGYVGRLYCSSFCTESRYDWLDVHDSDDDGILLAEVSGCEDGQTVNITSTGPVMHVLWTSDSETTESGFHCTYNEVCQHGFRQEEGACVLDCSLIDNCAQCTAPGHCDVCLSGYQANDGVCEVDENIGCSNNSDVTVVDYGIDEDMCWTFTAQEGRVGRLQCSSFCTESTFDNLRVYDNYDGQLFILETFSGCEAGKTVDLTSTSNVMHITWTTDSSVNENGFSCSYSEVCPTGFIMEGDNCVVCPTGYILEEGRCIEEPCSSDTYLNVGNYEHYSDMCWHWTATDGMVGRLTCSNFCTEKDYDRLKVYDGTSADEEALIADLSGCNLSVDVTTTGADMYVSFTSDGSVSYDGFNCTYTLDEPCNSDTDLIVGNYEHNTDMCWHWTTTGGMVGRLTCNNFCTEENYDRLKVYDGTSADEEAMIADLSGCNLSVDVTTTGADMYVTFTSDDSVSYEGFNCTYTPVCPALHILEDDMCIFDCGVIENCEACTVEDGCIVCAPGFDARDGECHADCVDNVWYCAQCGSDGMCEACWQGYTLDNGMCTVDCSLLDHCTECSTPGQCDVCNHGYDSIDGVCVESCPELVGCAYCSLGRHCFECMDGYTMNNLNQCEPEAVCSSHREIDVEQYDENEYMCWTFTAQVGFAGRLQCSRFCTEARYDFLHVYDVMGGERTPIGSISGCEVGKTVDITGAGAEMYLEWRSDGSNNGGGFSCSYSEVCPAGFVLEESACVADCSMLGNCTECHIPTECAVCDYGYRLMDGVCEETCSTHCELCSPDNSECIFCTVGYSKNYQGMCEVLCSANCVRCDEPYMCDECNEGYTLEHGSCNLDCSALDGCLFCTSSDMCDTCNRGYRLEGGLCIETDVTERESYLIVLDISYHGGITDSIDDLLMTAVSDQLVPMLQTSLLPIHPDLLQLGEMMFYQTSDRSLRASSRLYVQPQSFITRTSIEASLNTAVTGWLLGMTVPVAGDLAIPTEDLTVQITVCGKNCESCNEDDHCDSCVTGFTYHEDSQSCGGDFGCYTVPHCNRCIDLFTCDECSPGYVIFGPGHCMVDCSVIPDCAQCVSPSLCTECNVGYRRSMDGSRCIDISSSDQVGYDVTLAVTYTGSYPDVESLLHQLISNVIMHAVENMLASVAPDDFARLSEAVTYAFIPNNTMTVEFTIYFFESSELTLGMIQYTFDGMFAAALGSGEPLPAEEDLLIPPTDLTIVTTVNAMPHPCVDLHHCLICSDDQQMCEECYLGYTLEAGQCVAALPDCTVVVPHCTECLESAMHVCAQCEQGYALEERVCVATEHPCVDIENCLVCTAAGDDELVCEECYVGYTLQDGHCVASESDDCTLYVPHCTQCVDWYTCGHCDQGYMLQDGECVEEGTGPEWLAYYINIDIEYDRSTNTEEEEVDMEVIVGLLSNVILPNIEDFLLEEYMEDFMLIENININSVNESLVTFGANAFFHSSTSVTAEELQNALSHAMDVFLGEVPGLDPTGLSINLYVCMEGCSMCRDFSTCQQCVDGFMYDEQQQRCVADNIPAPPSEATIDYYCTVTFTLPSEGDLVRGILGALAEDALGWNDYLVRSVVEAVDTDISDELDHVFGEGVISVRDITFASNSSSLQIRFTASVNESASVPSAELRGQLGNFLTMERLDGLLPDAIADAVTVEFRMCDAFCLSCPEREEDCDTCAEGYYLSITNHPDGMTNMHVCEDTPPPTPVACSAHCLYCDSSEECVLCDPGYMYVGNNCTEADIGEDTIGYYVVHTVTYNSTIDPVINSEIRTLYTARVLRYVVDTMRQSRTSFLSYDELIFEQLSSTVMRVRHNFFFERDTWISIGFMNSLFSGSLNFILLGGSDRYLPEDSTVRLENMDIDVSVCIENCLSCGMGRTCWQCISGYMPIGFNTACVDTNENPDDTTEPAGTVDYQATATISMSQLPQDGSESGAPSRSKRSGAAGSGGIVEEMVQQIVHHIAQQMTADFEMTWGDEFVGISDPVFTIAHNTIEVVFTVSMSPTSRVAVTDVRQGVSYSLSTDTVANLLPQELRPLITVQVTVCSAHCSSCVNDEDMCDACNGGYELNTDIGLCEGMHSGENSMSDSDGQSGEESQMSEEHSGELSDSSSWEENTTDYYGTLTFSMARSSRRKRQARDSDEFDFTDLFENVEREIEERLYNEYGDDFTGIYLIDVDMWPDIVIRFKISVAVESAIQVQAIRDVLYPFLSIDQITHILPDMMADIVDIDFKVCDSFCIQCEESEDMCELCTDSYILNTEDWRCENSGMPDDGSSMIGSDEEPESDSEMSESEERSDSVLGSGSWEGETRDYHATLTFLISIEYDEDSFMDLFEELEREIEDMFHEIYNNEVIGISDVDVDMWPDIVLRFTISVAEELPIEVQDIRDMLYPLLSHDYIMDMLPDMLADFTDVDFKVCDAFCTQCGEPEDTCEMCTDGYELNVANGRCEGDGSGMTESGEQSETESEMSESEEQPESESSDSEESPESEPSDSEEEPESASSESEEQSESEMSESEEQPESESSDSEESPESEPSDSEESPESEPSDSEEEPESSPSESEEQSESEMSAEQSASVEESEEEEVTIVNYHVSVTISITLSFGSRRKRQASLLPEEDARAIVDNVAFQINEIFNATYGGDFVGISNVNFDMENGIRVTFTISVLKTATADVEDIRELLHPIFTVDNVAEDLPNNIRNFISVDVRVCDAYCLQCESSEDVCDMCADGFYMNAETGMCTSDNMDSGDDGEDDSDTDDVDDDDDDDDDVDDDDDGYDDDDDDDESSNGSSSTTDPDKKKRSTNRKRRSAASSGGAVTDDAYLASSMFVYAVSGVVVVVVSAVCVVLIVSKQYTTTGNRGGHIVETL